MRVPMVGPGGDGVRPAFLCYARRAPRGDPVRSFLLLSFSLSLLFGCGGFRDTSVGRLLVDGVLATMESGAYV